MPEEQQNESWAVVELMGHVTMAGRLSEEERFGSKLGRIDIPDGAGGFSTVYFGGSGVYRISPVSEDAARIKAMQNQPRPVHAWELPPAKPAPGVLPYRPDEEDEPDDPEQMEF